MKKKKFPLYRKKNSFSKSAYSKNFAEKIENFRIFFFNRKILPKTRRMSPVEVAYDQSSSLWQFLKLGIFEGGEGGGLIRKQDSVLRNQLIFTFNHLMMHA